MSRRRGFTLIECLMTLLILVWMSGVLFTVLVSAKKIFHTSINRAMLRQDLQTILWRLSMDARDTDVSNVTIVSSPSAVAFLSAYDKSTDMFMTDLSGAPIFSKAILYYAPTGSTRLLRKELPGPYSTALTSSQVTAACDGSGAVLSSSVTSFTPQIPTGTSTLYVTCTATQSTLEKITQEMKIWMRD